MRKIALVSALLLLAGVSAFAENLPNYAALKLGGYFPMASDVEDFDNGFYGELALGHYFSPNFAAELGVGYTTTSDNFLFADFDLTIIPVTVGVKGSLPMGIFEPYAMAGLGAYFTELESIHDSSSENDTAFGYYLGLGANFNITKSFLLGLEGKYFWAEPNFAGEDVKVDGITATFNIGYRF